MNTGGFAAFRPNPDDKEGSAVKERNWYHLLPLGLTALGLAAGYLYYALVGCASGVCPITSNPVVSALYGGMLGYLAGVILAPAPQPKAVPARIRRR